jgi:hypothetical protein
MQTVHTLDTGHTAVETRLVHSSGDTFTSGAWVMPESPNPQAAGSQLTYWRRYQLATFVGVAGSDDDDAAQVPDYAQTRPVLRTDQHITPADAQAAQDAWTHPARDPEPPPVTGGAPAMSEFSGSMAATAKQLAAIRGMAQTLGVGAVKAGEFAHWVVNQRDGNDLPDGYLLTKADASYVIEQLKEAGRDLADQWQGGAA